MAGLIVEILFMLFSVYNSVYSTTGHELSYFHLRVLTKLNYLITIEKKLINKHLYARQNLGTFDANQNGCYILTNKKTPL